jgi:hypothetical protein
VLSILIVQAKFDKYCQISNFVTQVPFSELEQYTAFVFDQKE